VAIAARLHVSELMIGLTLVGFGTSLPELVTSVTAALDGKPGLAVGNVVGSNIANVLLVLAVAALIRPVVSRPEAFFRDATALAIATAVGAGLVLFGHIGRLEGALLIAGLAVFIHVVYVRERRHPTAASSVLVGEARVAEQPPKTLARASILVAGGLGGVIGGAWLLVNGAVELARMWGVSETFIGLSVVAVGTSLPEFVITAVASVRGRSDVALGNIMGSNIFNLAAILGATALVTPIEVPPDLRFFDLLAMVGATVLLIVTAATSMRVKRWEGALLLACYGVYIALRAGVPFTI